MSSSTHFTKYQAQVWIWSSSHLREHRFLPFWIEKNIYFSNFDLDELELIGTSGEKISSGIGRVISSKAIDIFPFPQIHFVILGDNDLRPNRKNAKSCYETMEFFEELIKDFSNFSNSHLVISSIIPSPLTDDVSRVKNNRMNILLNEAIKAEKCKRVSFMNITNNFVFEGEIRRTPFQLFDRDGIHLTSTGANLLADCLQKHLEKLPKFLFS